MDENKTISKKTCIHCGNVLEDDQFVCPKCGKPQFKEKETKPKKNYVSKSRKFAYYWLVGCTIVTGIFLLPLLWSIPLTKEIKKYIDNNERISYGMLLLIFFSVSRVAGICLLIDDADYISNYSK